MLEVTAYRKCIDYYYYYSINIIVIIIIRWNLFVSIFEMTHIIKLIIKRKSV